jgi:hypothetical protein
MTEEQTHLKSQLIAEDKSRTNSVASLSSDEVSLLPEVAFAPSSNNGSTIDSPRVNRENQPLLGRMESDVTFNNFPGKFGENLVVCMFVAVNVTDKKAIKIDVSVPSHVVCVCIGAISVYMCHISMY